jgi:uncharacterized protein (TIGR02145 family)
MRLFLGSFAIMVIMFGCSPTAPTQTYTVTYDGNGNTGGTVPSPQTKTKGTALTLAANSGDLFKVGYMFSGWNTAANGSGTEYLAGSSYTEDANDTLFAQWTSTVQSGPSITDADGNLYSTMVLGTQVWMVENLRTTKYNDGTAIPLVTDSTQWANLTTPGHCFYNNSVLNTEKQKWGALYNWYAVSTGKLAPTGWHVATDADWDTLQKYLIAFGHNYDGTLTGNKIAKALAVNTDWEASSIVGTPGNSPTTNNTSHLSAIPGGFRFFAGSFYYQSIAGRWWSATAFNASSAYSREINNNNESLTRGNTDFQYGYSIRLVKD